MELGLGVWGKVAERSASLLRTGPPGVGFFNP